MILDDIMLIIALVALDIVNIVLNKRHKQVFYLIFSFINSVLFLEVFSIVIVATKIPDVYATIMHVLIYILFVVFVCLFIEKWKKQTFYDKMTGVENRFSYNIFLQEYSKNNKPCSVIFFDINNLKETNDTLGHDYGDILIIETSKILNQVFKKYQGFFYRIGGDEFLGVLKTIDEKMVKNAINLIQNDINIHNLKNNGQISISIGYAIKKDKEKIEDTIKRADEQMYKNKKVNK